MRRPCRGVRPFALLALLLAFPAVAQYEFGACEREEVWRATLAEWGGNAFRVVREGEDEGFGFAVGWDGGEIWIATPAHVAYGSVAADAGVAEVLARREGAAERLTVRPLSGDAVLPLCAGEESVQGFGPFKPGQSLPDLAFVCVERPPGLFLQRELAAAAVRPGDEYRLLVAPGLPAPDALGGRLAAAVNGDGRHVELESTSELLPTPGTSGAMVVTPAGLAALYLGWEERGRALTLDAVRREARDADLPWTLAPSEHFDCTAQREVCFAVAPPLRPPALSVESRGRRTAVALTDGEACVSLGEGPYTLAPSGGRLRCEPMGLRVVGGSGPLAIEVTCRPDFAGGWSAGPLGELYCTQGVVDDAACFGLDGVGRGPFSGSLAWKQGRAVLGGRFQSSYPVGVEATLEWTEGNLSGELVLADAGTEPIAIVLRPVPEAR